MKQKKKSYFKLPRRYNHGGDWRMRRNRGDSQVLELWHHPQRKGTSERGCVCHIPCSAGFGAGQSS